MRGVLMILCIGIGGGRLEGSGGIEYLVYIG